jgi:hypothetical protein
MTQPWKTRATLVSSILVGSFLVRWWFQTNYFPFFGDAGSDLTIAKLILEEGHRPLIGPILSLQNFFTPPSYYYFLAAALLLFPNVKTLGIFFIFLSVMGQFFYFIVLQRISSFRFAVLWLGLSSISVQLIFINTGIWQPYPLFFLSGLILLLLSSAEKPRFSLFCVASACVVSAIAFSIYPSGIGVYPFVLMAAARVFIKQKKTTLFAYGYAGVCLFLSTFFVSTPQFIFEARHHWPTLGVLRISLAQGSSLFSFVERVASNFILIFNQSIFSLYLQGIPYAVFVLLIICTSILSWRYFRHLHDRVFMYFDPLWIGLGFLIINWYSQEQFPHRFISVLPFFSIWLLRIFFLFFFINSKTKLISLLVLFLFCFHNTFEIRWWGTRWPLAIQTYQHLTYPFVEQMAEAVRQKNRSFSISVPETRITVFTREDTFGYHAAVFDFLFFDEGYRSQLHPHGNFLFHHYDHSSNARFFYLFCVGFRLETDQEQCAQNFVTKLPVKVEMIDDQLLSSSNRLYLFQRGVDSQHAE